MFGRHGGRTLDAGDVEDVFQRRHREVELVDVVLGDVGDAELGAAKHVARGRFQTAGTTDD